MAICLGPRTSILPSGLARGGSGSVTLLTPLPIWDRLLHCRPAVAHGVFDLGPAQTDVGQNAIIKLLKRSRGILQIQLVSRTACEFP
jgi:hypothetical protein